MRFKFRFSYPSQRHYEISAYSKGLDASLSSHVISLVAHHIFFFTDIEVMLFDELSLDSTYTEPYATGSVIGKDFRWVLYYTTIGTTSLGRAVSLSPFMCGLKRNNDKSNKWLPLSCLKVAVYAGLSRDAHSSRSCRLCAYSYTWFILVSKANGVL